MNNFPNITEEWLNTPNNLLGEKLLAGYTDPKSIQERLLTEILQSASHCEIGKKFDFNSIHTIQEFQQRMPLTDWYDVEPYSDKMVEGAEDLLFPGRTQQFVKTSGTTGKDKLIPESHMSNIARALIQKLRLAQCMQAVPSLGGLLQNPKTAGKCLLPLTNAPVWSKTPSGIPCVSASGLTIGQTGMDHLMAFPLFILLNSNETARDYMIMRFAIESPDIRIIAGNNAGRLTSLVRMAQSNQEALLNDIEQGTIYLMDQVDPDIQNKLTDWLKPNPERAKTLRTLLKEGKPFTPVTYWSDLQLGLFWLSASVGRYVEELRPYLPSTTRLMDVGYGASEAKFNIPLIPEDPAGALSLATSFYEFIPIDCDSKEMTPLLCHELEIGKQYELIVTTWGGLYRYQMKDVVEVTGFIGRTPKIVFVTKSCEVLNLCGEKFYPDVVTAPIREALQELGLKLRQIQIYPDATQHRYFCYVEPIESEVSTDNSTLTARAHALFLEQSHRYEMNLIQGILNPIEVRIMKKGWQESLYADRLKPGMNISQIKLPIVINKPVEETWMR
jgi:hypothetical protein